MSRARVQSITSIEESPDAERRRRMLRYTIAMSIRMVCFGLLFFVHDWWLVVVVIAAIVLPYIAVVIANNGARRAGADVESPEHAALVLREPNGDRERPVLRPTVVDPPSGGDA
ncbi:DUF3099 domain-containing protein [Galbitalea sp. SE-J8]|uniref:DUF3099 domain-containing protein n=1 Tax=Galbitalea sp. SE-J8 TaxID=3054952 RepID=UPI00259CE116|nr:DUF3099 domain-containing protein [Galbitalea sp. SE-J8]MDM4763136.1 DUF3099 domain-containing protein [Galbitalea sp. SE-J8]